MNKKQLDLKLIENPLLINEKDIDSVFAKLNKKKENPFVFLFKKMRKEQPAIYDYIFEAEDDFTKDEREALTTTAAMGWYIIRDILGAENEVSIDFIDERLADNFDLFDELTEGNELEDNRLMETLSADNEQPVLMDFLASLISENPKNFKRKIREAAYFALLVHIKTVIDCLVLDEDEYFEDDEYSEEDEDPDRALDEIEKEINGIYKKYTKCEIYKALTERQKEDSKFIITSFSEMIYNYYEQKPENWNWRGASETCMYIMPRKITAEKELFTSILPVMVSFLNFASETGKIPNAKKIELRLPEIEGVILKNANDPNSWGMAKAFLSAAQEKGVDISDKDAMDRFLLDYNESLKTGIEPADNPHSTKAGRNEPCPCGSGKKYKKCCGA